MSFKISIMTKNYYDVIRLMIYTSWVTFLATVKATLIVTYYFGDNISRTGANMYSWTL
jgi:hypothetical protein